MDPWSRDSSAKNEIFEIAIELSTLENERPVDNIILLIDDFREVCELHLNRKYLNSFRNILIFDIIDDGILCSRAYQILIYYTITKSKFDAVAHILEKECVPNVGPGGGCTVKSKTIWKALDDVCLWWMDWPLKVIWRSKQYRFFQFPCSQHIYLHLPA
jgi:hypothetical protein